MGVFVEASLVCLFRLVAYYMDPGVYSALHFLVLRF